MWKIGEYCDFYKKIQRKNENKTDHMYMLWFLKENRREEWQHLQLVNQFQTAWRMIYVFILLNMNYSFATLQTSFYFVMVSNTIATNLI